MSAAQAGIEVFARPPDWLGDALDGNRVADSLRALPEVREAGRLSCRAVDLRLSRKGWLVWYDVTLAKGRSFSLTGSLDPSHLGAGASASNRETLPLGHPGWSAALPDLGLELRTGADDEGLPALGLLADPRRVRDLLEQAIDAQACPGIRITACEPRVVRHARGARVTLVIQLSYGPGADPGWPRAIVAKAHRGDEGAQAFTAMRALWQSDLSCGRVVRIAEPLAYLPEHRVLVQGFLPGERTLTDVLSATIQDSRVLGLDQLLAVLRRTADGLVALHSCDVRLGGGGEPAALLDRMTRTLGRLALTVPSVAGVADQLVAPLRQRAHDVPSEPPRPAHGAFRPAQVLVCKSGDSGDSGVAFIDFDGSCMAEPAFDVGRFRARLREIGLATPGGRHPPLSSARRAMVDELAEVFLCRYEEQRPVSRERVALWEDLELTTALAHTWPRGQLSRIPPLLSLLRQPA